uniref:Uncharacterized protein n=1 Tax=Vespula pensylvanica TaxID=30213 RepID=A0A834UCB3_VESPE|nr:hypothetical protein H0235_006086 [Vespula pensylvanica]
MKVLMNDQAAIRAVNNRILNTVTSSTLDHPNAVFTMLILVIIMNCNMSSSNNTNIQQGKTSMVAICEMVEDSEAGYPISSSKGEMVGSQPGPQQIHVSLGGSALQRVIHEGLDTFFTPATT